MLLVTYIVELKKVVKNYNALRVLDGVDFCVGSGEFIVIRGRSGVGKTTLLNIMGLLDKPDDGRILFDGLDVTDLDEDRRAEIRLRSIGFVFQFFNLIPELNVLENVMLPLLLLGFGRVEAERKALDVLRELGLGDLVYRGLGELSGGQLQRVAIARALVKNPKIILADEPFAHLDDYNRGVVEELFVRIVKDYGIPVVIATTDFEWKPKYYSRIGVLERGVLRF